jgi:hypothetical protein
MAVEGKGWLYNIVDTLGRTAQVENGLVVFKSNYKPLVYTPDGWQDILIGWERNMSEFGVNRNFSLPLGFVLDGKQIVDTIAYTKNFDEKLYLLIQKQKLFIDTSSFYFYYDKFYKGELDFTTHDQSENKSTISIMEGKLSKQLKAKKSFNYEIPLDDPEAITVKMDGINIQYEFQMLGADETYSVGTNQLLAGRQFFMTFYRADAGNQLLNVVTQDVYRGIATGIDYATDEDHWILKAIDTANITANFKFNFNLFKSPTIGFVNFRVSLYNQNGAIVHDFINENINSAAFYNQVVNVNDTVTLNLVAEDRLFLIASISGSPTGANPASNATITTTEQPTRFSYFSKYRSTTIKALKPYTLYKRLVGNISGDEANAISALLQAHPNLVVTSGDGLRSLPGDVVIKTSLNDFFTSFNVVLNAGMGIENNRLVFEDKAYFFDESDPIHLGKIRNFKSRWLTEILANSIKIGWPNQTYDDTNGKQEFNTTQERGSVVERISKTLELVSVYRADSFGAELTRINLEGKITTDSSADNDVFILNVDLSFQNEDDSYNLKRGTYDTIDGLLSPETAFNIEELTPARLLEKHRNWINSIFYGFESTALKFQTIDKNRELKTVQGATVYDEDADFIIGSSPRLLIPRVFEFEPETPDELVELMEANPNRCFSFEHPNGNIYKGFNLKVGIAPNDEQTQAFQLISAPSNDLKTLIDG